MSQMPAYQRAPNSRTTTAGLVLLAVSIVIGLAFSGADLFSLAAGIAGLVLTGIAYFAGW